MADGKTHIFATRRGRAFRNSILLRDLWSCQMCGAMLIQGRKSPRAAVVDHLRPTELRPDLALDGGNCQATCKQCHDTVCKSLELRHWPNADAIRQAKLSHRRFGHDATGRPLDPEHPWNGGAAAR